MPRDVTWNSELLEVIESEARRHGWRILRVETEVLKPDRVAVYRSARARETGCLWEYSPDPPSLFMEKVP